MVNRKTFKLEGRLYSILLRQQIRLSSILSHLRLMEQVCGVHSPIFFGGNYITSMTSLIKTSRLGAGSLRETSSDIAAQRRLIVHKFLQSVEDLVKKFDFKKREKLVNLKSQRNLIFLKNCVIKRQNEIISKLIDRLDKVESGSGLLF